MTEGQIERFLEGFNETEDCIDEEQVFNDLSRHGEAYVQSQSCLYRIYRKHSYEGRGPMVTSYDVEQIPSSPDFKVPNTAEEHLKVWHDRGMVFYSGPSLNGYTFGFGTNYKRKQLLLL